MAFAASGLCCIAVGQPKVYTYYTGDTLTILLAQAYFNSTNCPGLLAGDIILCAHATATLFAPIRITKIDATSSSVTGVTALA